jgi:hypothetical protein
VKISRTLIITLKYHRRRERQEPVVKTEATFRKANIGVLSWFCAEFGTQPQLKIKLKLVQLKRAAALCTIKRRINDQSSLMPPRKRQTRCVLKQLIAKPATNLHSHGHCRDPLLDVKDSNVLDALEGGRESRTVMFALKVDGVLLEGAAIVMLSPAPDPQLQRLGPARAILPFWSQGKWVSR